MSTLLLFPGAGASRDQATLVAVERVVAPEWATVRADFPYRKEGRKAPDRPPKLMAAVRAELASLDGPVVVGGRSMGGRICSMVAAGADGEGPPESITGAVLISYPLHPPGKSDTLRVDHLPDISVPCLFIHGTRDPFGTPDELARWTETIRGPVTHHWIEGRGHDLKGADGDVAAVARVAARPVTVAWDAGLGGHVVTGRTAAVEVLRDPDTFTVDDPRFSTARVVGPSMLSLDGADHTRHRQPYVPSFRARVVEERFAAFVAAEAERLVAAVRPGGDLRTAFAGPLAAAVVAETLGLGGGDRDVVARLLEWYRDIVDSVAGMASGAEPTDEGSQAMAELGAAIRSHLALPGDLTETEAVSNAAVIMFGGIETTEGTILNALWFVLGDPALRAELVRRPDAVASAVEESLRLEPAAAVVHRYATRDVELAGAPIRARDLVVVSLREANRDPAEFAVPDRFVLDRPNVRRHLAFAAGPHVCIGMDLARLEARVAVSTVLSRLPGARLAADAPAPSGLVFRKPASMVVEW